MTMLQADQPDGRKPGSIIGEEFEESETTAQPVIFYRNRAKADIANNCSDDGGIAGNHNETGEPLSISPTHDRIHARTQPVAQGREFCPTENKRFFCGIARKLGCQFCANK